MATKSYAGLKAIIISKIEALQGSDNTDLFSAVYGVAETKPDGFPVCFVLEKTGGGQILDTHRNEREWQFGVEIVVQVNDNRTPEEAYEALLDAVDRVIESFDQDPMLLDINSQAQCKWVRVVPVSFSFGTQETAYHKAELTIAVVDIVNRWVAS